MFWDFIDAILTPFNHLWQYLVVYLAGWWIVTVGLLRFGPRECSGKIVRRRDDYGHFVARQLTSEECMKAGIKHIHHVFLRQWAFFIGMGWPLVLYLFAPVILCFLFIQSFYRFGHVESLDPGSVD